MSKNESEHKSDAHESTTANLRIAVPLFFIALITSFAICLGLVAVEHQRNAPTNVAK
jgi:hypothetical protein